MPLLCLLYTDFPMDFRKEEKMLQKITLKLTYTGDAKASYNWGSMMHGVLMELLPADAAEAFHENGLRPFSQYVLPSGENNIEWNIGLWGDGMAEEVAKAVMPVNTLEIKHKGILLKVCSSERKNQSERDFMAGFFEPEKPCRKYELEFLTPCTHKSAGKHVLFPTTELMVQSLCMRFNAFSQEYSLDDPEAMKQIAENIHIAKYSLHSAQYHLDGNKVTGYMGKVTLYVTGPEQLARLAGMLLSFSEYSGIGVKTSLGMGGCRVKPILKETALGR